MCLGRENPVRQRTGIENLIIVACCEADWASIKYVLVNSTSLWKTTASHSYSDLSVKVGCDETFEKRLGQEMTQYLIEKGKRHFQTILTSICV